MSIDTDKWTVYNLDPDKVRIHKVITIDLITRNGDIAASFTRNMVISKKGLISGIFGFTMSSVRFKSLDLYHACGLYVDENNRIELYRSFSGNKQMNYRIVTGGSTAYEVADVDNDFGKFEVRVTDANVISLWKWNGSGWIQIGANQTYSLGTKYLFASSLGGNMGKLSISYCYIKTW